MRNRTILGTKHWNTGMKGEVKKPQLTELPKELTTATFLDSSKLTDRL